MLAPVKTRNSPEVAPVGIVKTMAEALQELIVMGKPFIVTTPLPCEAPKLEPEIPICVPADPVVALMAAIAGTAMADELTEAPSNVAVRRAELLLSTAKPT